MIKENREGYSEYNIPEDWYKNRTHGVSAMLRVGNEEEWIGSCLESILDFFDEIVITIECSDRTREIIETFDSSKINVYEYPFEINPNGPGHDEYPADSVHDRAYYYNWSLAQTTKTHVSKWDADMLMLPEYATEEFRQLVLQHNVVKMKGWEIVDEDFNYVSKTNPTTGKEVRFFEVNKRLHYKQGPLCENFTYPNPYDIFNMPVRWLQRARNVLTGNEFHVSDPTYLHTKHIKDSDKQAWPDNWEEMDHFQNINARKQPGDPLHVKVPEYCYRSPEDFLSSRE